MEASILVLCANRHFTGVTVTFYQCFGRFTGFRDGQGVHVSFSTTLSDYIAVSVIINFSQKDNIIEVFLPLLQSVLHKILCCGCVLESPR